MAEISGQAHSSTMTLSEILDFSRNFGLSEIFGCLHESAYYPRNVRWTRCGNSGNVKVIITRDKSTKNVPLWGRVESASKKEIIPSDLLSPAFFLRVGNG